MTHLNTEGFIDWSMSLSGLTQLVTEQDRAISEGFATSATLKPEPGFPTVSALDIGNLGKVAGIASEILGNRS